ncbi:hypothetical protein CA51_39750 [Rosistilla oblonga]|uniref:hypothetical protein n=1 Tax=Rosistilla oblonga TaxID=2527990 RepID=UPI00118C1799|nr:hypothetical protein [Rosistilla oblonga]QDV14081.1 hypothetical protein CA51_39750 [Rosistilla oblonga]
MTCHELAKRLLALQPELTPQSVAQLALLILNGVSDADELTDDQTLLRHWHSASFRLQAAADQHAAMTDELEQLAGDGPVKFEPDQIWTLLRAIKVQSQLLELYTDEPAMV